MKSDRPIVKTAIGSHYALPGERLLEFRFPSGRGGLISLRSTWEGARAVDRIEVYRCDPGVDVRGPAMEWDVIGPIYRPALAGRPDAPPESYYGVSSETTR